jgi:hypothetical protein
LEDQELIIIPGQTRPVGFQFQKNWGTVPSATILKTWVRIGLSVKEDGSSSYENEFAIRATSSVRCVDWMKSSFRYTFKDYDDTVQYGK